MAVGGCDDGHAGMARAVLMGGSRWSGCGGEGRCCEEWAQVGPIGLEPGLDLFFFKIIEHKPDPKLENFFRMDSDRGMVRLSLVQF